MVLLTRTKKSLYSALTGFLLTVVNGVLGLLITRMIIINYGSDFNGLNSVANQIVNLLLIIEGGITIATNVALFRPLSKKNYRVVNGIMSATKIMFNKIGTIFFLVGVLTSIIYSFFVKSDLSSGLIISIFLLTIIPTTFNLIFATKYMIIIQTEQKEYLINLVKIVSILLSQFLIYLVISFNQHVIFIRLITMMCGVLNGIILIIIAKRRYEFLDFRAVPLFNEVKGTGDVLIQKITGMIYMNTPIIFISVTAGTSLASVYFVYNSIFMFLKNLLYSIVNAPRMALGELLSEQKNEKVIEVFYKYQYIITNISLVLISTAVVLSMPFISFYTKGITDINYFNWFFLIILALISYFEILHIPSGNIIMVSGSFKILKKIQVIALIFLIIFTLIGAIIFGAYGVLFAVLTTSVVLACMEIYYAVFRLLKLNRIIIFNTIFPVTIFSVLLVLFELRFINYIGSFAQFLIAGIILLILNSIFITIFNFIFNNQLTVQVNKLLFSTIKSKYRSYEKGVLK